MDRQNSGFQPTDSGVEHDDSGANDNSGFTPVDSGRSSDTSSTDTGTSGISVPVTVKGPFGTTLYRPDDKPDVGRGHIEFVAVYDGVFDFHDDALIGPVSVGSSVSDEFRDEITSRIDDVDIRDS